MQALQLRDSKLKQWWIETFEYLKKTSKQINAMDSANVFMDIEKHKVEPLKLTRLLLLSDNSHKIKTNRKTLRQTYPLSTGCIEFDSVEKLLQDLSGEQLLLSELLKKSYRSKRNKKKLN